MAPLFTVIFLMTIFALFAQPGLRKGRINFFYIVMVVVLFLFMGLRTGYNDTAAYIRSFNRADPFIAFLGNAERMHIFRNPLFYGTVALVREFTDNYHVFFMMVAIFDSILLMRFIRDYCNGYFAYSVFLYWAYDLGTFGMAAMKQITAMAILTIAITALLEKKKKKFFVIVFIAGLIHTYAFLFLALPLFTTKPWNKKTFALLLATGSVMLSFNGTISTFLDYADAAGKSVASFEVFDGVQMNPFRIMIFAIVPIAILIYKDHLIPMMTEKQYLLSNMSIISLMFMLLGSVNGANMFGRLATYFVYGDICMLGWIIDNVFSRRSKRLAYILSIILFTAFIAYDNSDFSTTGGYSSISFFDFIWSLKG